MMERSMSIRIHTYMERLNSPLVFRQILNWDIWKITSDALRFLPVVRGRVPEHSHGPVAYGCFGCGGLSKLKPYRGRWCKHDVYDVSFLGFPLSFSLSFQLFPESVEMQLYILYTIYIIYIHIYYILYILYIYTTYNTYCLVWRNKSYLHSAPKPLRPSCGSCGAGRLGATIENELFSYWKPLKIAR